MATLSKRTGGSWMVQITQPDRRRATLHMGRMTRQQAEAVRGHVAALERCRSAAVPMPTATSEWLSSIADKMHAKIAALGLCQPRERKQYQLADVLDNYLARRTDLKPHTLENLRVVRKWLVSHFGADKDITTITRADAGDWHRSIKARYAPATVAMHVKKARQFFADAIDRRLITENPFRKIKAGSQVNDARNEYVPASVILQVIEACPDAEWRCIFALARFGGLRTPSETYALRWDDIDWQRNRMLVRASKTAHHEGKAIRIIPFSPLLAKEINRLARVGQYIIQQNRRVNLRTRAEKILFRAGVKPWPRLFQNLRASCETDWAAVVPIHVACQWAGNSAVIAKRHYLQVTEAHFATASGAANGAVSGGAEIPDISRPSTGQSMNSIQTGSEQLPPAELELRFNSTANEAEALKALHRRLHSSPSGQHNRLIERINRLGRPLRTIRRFRAGESAKALRQAGYRPVAARGNR